ncbi:phage tail protein [Deinococcus aquatilis]|jgi:phage tail-like protein|uniref:phage tail protein n=1 Tax=Deinococcus aquatilis TaxID=519440 RepID=UPI0003710246|nr:phage tail protein [Deinococcus aquatilis]
MTGKLTTDQIDRFQAHASQRYHISVDQLERAVFSEISGLQLETETMDVIEGGVNDSVLKIPVRSRAGNVTLKRGVTVGNELLHWYLRIMQGVMDRRTITVRTFRTNGELLARYELLNAYPVKWSGPALAATGDAAAIETLELTYQGVLLLNT